MAKGNPNSFANNQLTKECPSILNWEIQGCLDWQEQGLNPPQIVQEQVSAYKTKMDSIAQSVEQDCSGTVQLEIEA